MAPDPTTGGRPVNNTTAPKPKVTYPRPTGLRSPFAQKYGVGLSTKPGEVYVGTEMGKGAKNVPVDTFSIPGAFASLSPAAQQKLYKDAQAVYGHDKVPALNMDSFLTLTASNAYGVQQSTGLKVGVLNYWDYYKQSGGPGLNAYAKSGSGSGSGGAGGGYSGPVTSKSKQTSVNLTDPTSARGLVDAAMTQYLGRRPTQKEYANFLQQLNSMEEKNPSVTTQTSVTTPGVGSSSTVAKSKTTGGSNAQQYAVEYARGQEGAAEYTAATTVADAFISLLGE